MTNLQILRPDSGSIEDGLGAIPPSDARALVPLLATREIRAALAREQEHAALEAADILSQADEALVMG
jgi:hypothetical protein